ncbi:MULTISPECIES: DUF5710 domain-containing protein [unclassified Candidatus Tisiphia]|uniref:DUF5710 domain-containing protein n=1 Tax=unclassified Candidatus Tisiphia TaxID=2996318 RepID=UPI00312C9901
MINLIIIAVIFIFFYFVIVNYKRIIKFLPKGNKNLHISDLTIRTRTLNADEILKFSRERQNNQNVAWNNTFSPKNSMEKIDEDKIQEHLYKNKVTECLELVKKEIKDFQFNSITNSLMIPLCVPYSDRNNVKQFGSVWDPRTKSWFWSFDKDTKLIEKWLPRMYQKNATPIILPRLVPEPLWYLNLRSLLPKEEWDYLRKLTYEESGYRCIICGCKGKKWPVECDEIWSYDDDYSKEYSMVCFQGLQSLCPYCHQVHHFGKARVDGNDDMAMARLMVLNGWSIEKAQKIVAESFDKWEERSLKKWLFNSDVLETRYKIYIRDNSYLKRVVDT